MAREAEQSKDDAQDPAWRRAAEAWRGRIVARALGIGRPVTQVRVDRDLAITMTDGTVLLADRWHPVAVTDAPILLARLPYGRGGLYGLIFRVLAEQGFQVVAVSTRGTFGSGGDWVPFRNEQADGTDVLAWLPTQPWFVPNVATTGGSYFGMTQWATAEDPPPWLKAMTLAITSSWFRDPLYPGGTFALETALSWIHGVERQEQGLRGLLRTLWSRRDVDAGASAVPLADADLAVVGHRVAFFQDWLDHADHGDPWWHAVDFGPAIPTAPPANLVAGWYDFFLPYQLADYRRLRDAGQRPRLLVGPWWHGSREGALAFVRETVDWADVHLRGRPSARDHDVRVFVMGADEWLDLDEWPPAATPTPFHLGDGFRLGADEPTAAGPDRFRYDPSDPTPSVGGASLSSKAGAKDNEPRESRADVLTYTTTALDRDLTAIGEVVADLYVRSSLEHFDLFVRLCDVDPDGTSINIADGVLRVSPGAVEPAPDGVLLLQVPLFPTAVTFQRGHRIRLQVSSGAHPVHARNLGAGEPIGRATTFRVADQEVFHDPAHPSRLVLPVVGARGE